MSSQRNQSTFAQLVSALASFLLKVKSNPHASARRSTSPDIPSVQTRYMSMLLHLDEIPRLDTILAGLFTWVLLAGYVVFPGTFTSLRNSKTVKNAGSNSNAEKTVVNTVQNVPLLWLAAICCIIGALGMCWLWWRWQENFIWLINRIFL